MRIGRRSSSVLAPEWSRANVPAAVGQRAVFLLAARTMTSSKKNNEDDMWPSQAKDLARKGAKPRSDEQDSTLRRPPYKGGYITRFGPDDPISVAQARDGAETWRGLMDQSLRELGVDHVDAYYVMAAHNPNLVKSEEMRRAFEAARDAGKVKYWGLSTHQNAQNVLEAAMETGAYHLAQIAITPAGWYDWADKNILPGSASMKDLRPFLERVRESGIALIGMKAGRYLAGRKFLGWGKPDAFDDLYDADFLASGLSPFQRSYAYVLGHGLDAVNADMQSFAHLEENLAAAATSTKAFA